MTKWLYSTCFINELPLMGEAGWEAYAIYPHSDDASTPMAYLKRPRTLADSAPVLAPAAPAPSVAHHTFTPYADQPDVCKCGERESSPRHDVGNRNAAAPAPTKEQEKPCDCGFPHLSESDLTIKEQP